MFIFFLIEINVGTKHIFFLEKTADDKLWSIPWTRRMTLHSSSSSKTVCTSVPRTAPDLISWRSSHWALSALSWDSFCLSKCHWYSIFTNLSSKKDTELDLESKTMWLSMIIYINGLCVLLRLDVPVFLPPLLLSS